LPLLLETIKIENGEVFNLHYHQKRFDKSRLDLFGDTTEIDLSTVTEAPKKELYRCRILYDTQIRSIEYIPYRAKVIRTLKVVPARIEYAYKYANRDAFNTLLQNHPDVDEIIIEKDGFITDTTISNLAFYDGVQWLTPANPLLPGTMRAKLLDEKVIFEAPIQKKDLKKYTHVALMNAMIGFNILNNPTITT
jgi:4-amino-4-deoxychorismate lyase